MIATIRRILSDLALTLAAWLEPRKWSLSTIADPDNEPTEEIPVFELPDDQEEVSIFVIAEQEDARAFQANLVIAGTLAARHGLEIGVMQDLCKNNNAGDYQGTNIVYGDLEAIEAFSDDMAEVGEAGRFFDRYDIEVEGITAEGAMLDWDDLDAHFAKHPKVEYHRVPGLDMISLYGRCVDIDAALADFALTWGDTTYNYGVGEA